MSGGGGQQGAAAPAQGQMGQGAAQPQGGGMPQQQPQINPQTIQDVQNLIQQYQSGQLGGAQRGFARGGFTNARVPNPGGPYGGFNPAPPPAAGPNMAKPMPMPMPQAQNQAQFQTNMMQPVPMPAPAGGPYGGFNAQGQGNPANYQPSQEAINTYDKWKADQDRPLGPGEIRNQMAMLDPRSPEAMQMQMMQANRAQQPQGQEQFQNNMMRPMPMPQPQGPISVGAFSPQSPMGGFPQQPQGAGPDVTGNSPAVKMGYDQSGSDAGIGGQAVQGVQNPAGMGGQMSLAGGPYGGINPQTAGPMPVGNKPLSLPQLRPQQSGLQIAGNPSTQPVFKGRQRGMRR